MPCKIDKSFEKLANDIYEFKLLQNKSEEMSTKLADANSEKEWVELAFVSLQEIDLLPFSEPSVIDQYKSSEESIRIRNQGNIMFMKKSTFRDALLLYTRSIAIAPYPSVELSLAFANRSAVLFAIKKYHDCLRDIEQAITFLYPDSLMHKLLERRGKCYENIGMIQEARRSFQSALDYLRLADPAPSQDKIRVLTKTLEHLLVNSDKSSESIIVNEMNEEVLPRKTCGEHNDIGCFSGALAIKSSPSRGGRFVEATTDIKPGDVISVEKPYASIVWSEYCYIHCNGCSRRCDSMVPCEYCNVAMYCSAECRDLSWRKFHRIECQVIPALLEYYSDETMHLMLALRMLIVARNETHSLLGLKQQLEAINETSDTPFTGMGAFTPLKAIYSLMRHSKERTKMQKFEIAITSACAVNCLEVHSDFFSTSEILTDATTDWKQFAGGLLMEFHQIVTCNSFSLVDCTLTISGEGEETQRTDRHVQFGSGIYVFGAMANHSCGPNAFASYSNGNTQVVAATRPIRKGEEMLFSYGPKYSTVEIAERKSILKTKYFFDCDCEACHESWPIFLNVPSKRAHFNCRKCRILLPDPEQDSKSLIVQCKHCKDNINLHQLAVQADSVIKDLSKIRSHLNAGIKSPESLIRQLSKYMSETDEVVQRPSNIFFYGEELMKQALAHSANYYTL